MPQRHKFSSPVVRRLAGFDANYCRIDIREPSQDVRASQLPPDNNFSCLVHAVHLKDMLCDFIVISAARRYDRKRTAYRGGKLLRHVS